MLPDGWARAKLGEVIKLSSGDKKPNDTVKEISRSHHIPVYGGNGIMGYSTLSNTSSECISIGRVGEYCGSVHAIKNISWITDNSLYTKEISKNCDFSFIYYLLINSNIPNLRNKGGQPLVSQKPIYGLPILLPPLPEQKKIAAILSTWDRAIEGTEKLLANSQQQKKALMQQLLTGKKRLPGFTGEWRNLKLKTFLQESVIPSPQPDPKKRITVRLNLNGVEKREVRGTESIDATNYFTRKAGQFIYGKQNIHKGAFGIIPKILDGFETSQDIPCFDFLPNVCPAWFFYYFARENIHHTLETKMTGTGSKRLNQKTFLNLTCHAPPISEQQAIAAVLTTADEEITALESDLSRLRQEKKALMQQLLTGKRRVKVD